MRILYLTNDRTARVCDFYRPLQDALSERAEVEVIRRDIGMLEGAYCRTQVIDQVRNEPLVDPVHANEFDWILTDAMYSYLWEDWGKITTKKGVLWADQHGGWVKRYIGDAWGEFGFDLFMPLYRDSTQVYHPYLDRARIKWLPYWIDTKVFRDYALPKKYIALQTGVVHPTVYPWRHKIMQALDGQPYFKRIQRPPDDLGRKNYWPVGKDYARVLNRSLISFACTSRFHYSLTKLFEIPAARSVLFCDWIPEMRGLGFVPGENFVLYEGEGEALREYIESWLNRPKRLSQIAYAGMKLMTERHTAPVRAAQLLKILQRFSDHTPALSKG